MRVMEEKNSLYLLVDIDDLIVKSSDKLQKILDEKTNFKTSTLNMLEQLNRNCRYVLHQVEKECLRAKESGSIPNLSRFPNYDNYIFKNNDEKCYEKPVLAAKYYSNVANMLLNQFLEERDTFLEIDNLPKGQIKKFDYQKELETTIKFSKLIQENKSAFYQINKYCLKEAERLVEEAKISGTIPNYGELVSMDTNDIIKDNRINSESELYKDNIIYIKPLYEISNAITLLNNINDIIINAKVFNTPSDEIVDYSKIHSLINVNWRAVGLVENLIHSGVFKKVYFSTHHNGEREEKAKRVLMQQIVPEIDGFIGQRFHDTEHDGVRRGRSSKIDRAIEILQIPAEKIVLLDDSKANCGDCKSKGGTEILYKPATDSEIIKSCLEDTGFNRILDFNNHQVYQFIAEAYVKQKKYHK